MFSPNTHNPKPTNLVAFAFLLTAFLTGIASSFQLPTLSLFLSQEINVSPIMVGNFYAINAVIGILLSQILARYSDKQEDRRKVIIFCCLIAVAGCLIFAYSRNYYVLVLFGTALLGLGSSSNPQSFALAREYAGNTKHDAVMFTTIMRTQISLAWIVGPPLSFAIALNWGFDLMYLVAGLAFLLCALVSFTLLPKIVRTQQIKTQELQDTPRTNRKSTMYLFIACFLMWTCNSMYLINMPLYIINELHLPKELGGTLMATAAGLEIPIMLLAGYLNKYFSKKQLMIIALATGLTFYIGLFFAHETWQLLALQILNAVLIGITATIGMVYFQDLMPHQMGAATTLFSNTAKSSWIIGGPLAGLLTQIWSYNSVFCISVLLLVASLVCMLKVKSV
ncbi:MAG TPA: MFS transporter [Pasteurellaceae bacterium]|nr:MFS transporter [Pasteurellaceae bacterium]